jgi:hypothetical protein
MTTTGTPDDGERMPEPTRSFNQRLRDRFYGRRPAPETSGDASGGADAGTPSARPKSNQMGFFGRVQRPGGFDEPPEEPVELEGPLPWELGGEKRDDD